MSKKVLSIGQCSFDHGNLSQVFSRLGAQTIKVDLHRDARAAIGTHSPALILINRVNDTDGSSGVDLVKELKLDAELAGVPIMLVSDYESAQQSAVVAGAQIGFGKSSLHSAETISRLREILKP